MHTVPQLLDDAKARQNIDTDYRLSKVLGVFPSAIKNYRAGRSFPDDRIAGALAELAGLDPDTTVATMHALRAATPTERDRWQRIAERLERSAATTAALAAVCLGMLLPTPQAHAYAGAAGEGLKIMSTRKRRIMAALALLILQSRQQ